MNDLRNKTDAQLRSENRAILRELSSRRKAARPKRRKVRSSEERERARKYEAFKLEHCSGDCWKCGRWGGHIPLQRAHITKDGLSKRLEDVRLINALCPVCHEMHTRGAISTETMIAIKRRSDPDNYDPEFLQKHSVRRLAFP